MSKHKSNKVRNIGIFAGILIILIIGSVFFFVTRQQILQESEQVKDYEILSGQCSGFDNCLIYLKEVMPNVPESMIRENLGCDNNGCYIVLNVREGESE